MKGGVVEVGLASPPVPLPVHLQGQSFWNEMNYSKRALIDVNTGGQSYTTVQIFREKPKIRGFGRKVIHWIKSGFINQILIRVTRWREHGNKKDLKYQILIYKWET